MIRPLLILCLILGTLSAHGQTNAGKATVYDSRGRPQLVDIATQQELNAAIAGVSVAVPSNRIPYGTGTAVTSEAGFEYDPTTNTGSMNVLKLQGNISLFRSANGVFNLYSETSASGDPEDITFSFAATNATVTLGSGTGISIWDFGVLRPQWTTAPRTVPTAMGALAVDLTKALNTKTITGNVTMTFSGSLTNGEYSELRVENSGASQYTVTLPASVYSSSGSATVASFTVPAAASGVNGMTHVTFSSDGTRLRIYQGGGGGPVDTANLVVKTGETSQSISGNLGVSGAFSALTLSGDLDPDALPATMPARTYETITTLRSRIYTPIAAVGNVIVTSDAHTEFTADGSAETMTYSGTPPEGTGFRATLRDFAGDSSSTTYTIPSTYSFGLTSNRTSFVVPEGKFVVIDFVYLDGAYMMVGETIFLKDLPDAVSPTSAFLVELGHPLSGESGKAPLTTVRDLTNGSQSGTQAAPITVNSAPTWSGESHVFWVGGTLEADLPVASDYVNRAITFMPTGAFTLTVDPDAADGIIVGATSLGDGVADSVTTVAGVPTAYVSDGVNWQKIAGGGGLSSASIDTSSELRAILTDENGTGALLFSGATNPSFIGLTNSGQLINSANGAASTPPVTLTGTVFTGGSATTTKPSFLIEPTGTTSTGWSTSGTLLGGNAPSGFSGRLFDFQVNGTATVYATSGGAMQALGGYVTNAGNMTMGHNAGQLIIGASSDLLYTREAAAIAQWGVDAASPVTQTLKGADARAGTDTNTAGGRLNITGGRNTGTGTAGSVVIQTSAAAVSGTLAGTSADRLTVSGTAITAALPVVLKSYTVATLPTGVEGAVAYVTDASSPTYRATVAGGGSDKVMVFYNGTNWICH